MIRWTGGAGEDPMVTLLARITSGLPAYSTGGCPLPGEVQLALQPRRRRPVKAEVVIVGAGVAGTACARVLHEAGVACQVVEKARGVGGRMATRRTPQAQFDHGAKHFRVEGDEFRAAVEGWQLAGVVAEWRPRGPNGVEVLPGGRMVGVPGMSQVPRHLAEGIPVRLATRVTALVAAEGGWGLAGEDGELLAQAPTVLVTAPAPQAAALLAGVPELAAAAQAVPFAPRWALLAAFAAPLPAAFDAYKGDGGILGWVAREAAKPGRPATEAWVAHATPEWSAAHLEEEPERVAPTLLEALGELFPQPLPPTSYLAAHRWRFARPVAPLGQPFLWDPRHRLGAAGDWCLGRGVEAAYLSGRALAAAVLASDR